MIEYSSKPDVITTQSGFTSLNLAAFAAQPKHLLLYSNIFTLIPSSIKVKVLGLK